MILSVNCSENRTWIEVFFEGDLMHPKTVEAGEFLRGKTLDQTIAQKAGEMALEGAKPLKDNVYKVKMAQDLIQRGLLASV